MYTERSLRSEIARIYRNPSDGFMWEQTKSATVTLDDVVRYCWVPYDKARSATGAQVIGRTWDLHQPLRTKIANLLKGQTLFTKGTTGNILEMDKWCAVLNDCWLLGGIHREAPFQLMSMPTWKNSWDPKESRFVVTARELIGLKLFGYERQTGPGGRDVQATYMPRSTSKARDACLEDYHFEVALRETRGPIGVADLIV